MWRHFTSAIIWFLLEKRNRETSISLSPKKIGDDHLGQPTISSLFPSMKVKLSKWALLRKKFENDKLTHTMHYWESCTRLWCQKGGEDHAVSSSLHVLEFNVQGVSRGKLGPAGIEGVPVMLAERCF